MTERYIGLMSGTSLDAIDAVLLECDAAGTPRITHTHTEAPESDLRSALLTVATDTGNVSLRQLGELHQQTGAWFALAANNLMAAAQVAPTDIRAVGSHGQTLLHAPEARFPFSWQCGDANVIAARSGITTVADFRQADIVAGGQGAPLVPAFHSAVFAHGNESRCIVNIGGIANITALPAIGTGEPIIGFDTGPGNALLDSWTQQHLGAPQDTDAHWAAGGAIDSKLLEQLKADAYFRQPPPKSTGRETFNLSWLRGELTALGHAVAPVDVQRTLVELTAVTIADAVAGHAPGADRVILCGGGAHNPLLRQRLSTHLPGHTLEDTGEHGIHVDWVEAAAFAWLAMRTLHGQSGNLPSVTGAHKAVVLGAIHDPRMRA